MDTFCRIDSNNFLVILKSNIKMYIYTQGSFFLRSIMIIQFESHPCHPSFEPDFHVDETKISFEV